jgi:hypothetical protein
VLECKAAGAATCVTADQVAKARKMYEPARNVRTGKAVSPAFTPGNELGWGTLIGGQEAVSLGMDQFKNGTPISNRSWLTRASSLCITDGLIS